MARSKPAERSEAKAHDCALPFADLEAELVGLLGSGDEGAIDMVDAALGQAILHRASDLHLEPWADCVALRYRIDGILHEVAHLPHEHLRQITGRIKVLARMLTYEKDVPQDGRIDPERTPCRKAMRVSSFPTVYGEKTVIRILDADPALFAVDALGFGTEVVEALRDLIDRPQGTLLLTGPASSGKTTTIYALLKEILEARAPSTHVVTIEDPVEYRLGRVSQTEVKPHSGFTFEAALRAVLRQDPEVIVLGEIRDPETARVAIQAGLTGHLVISTIHSGAAAGVFTRLLDMSVEPFLIASSVTGVLAQRLVRRNCTHCGAPYAPDPELRARFGLAKIDAAFRHGAGCEACQGIGYLGRTAIGEILTINDTIADLVLSHARTQAIHEAAVRDGMVPLAADAAKRVRQGATTIEEVKRVLPVPTSPPPDLTATDSEMAKSEFRIQNPESRIQNPPSGFSLVELMVALFVFTVGMLGTMQLYHFGLDKIRTMREAALATQAVQNEVEVLRAMPFAELADRVDAAFVSAPDQCGPLVNLTPSLTVCPHANGALRLKQVTASIRWTGDNGRTMAREVTTLIADKAPGGRPGPRPAGPREAASP